MLIALGICANTAIFSPVRRAAPSVQVFFAVIHTALAAVTLLTLALAGDRI